MSIARLISDFIDSTQADLFNIGTERASYPEEIERFLESQDQYCKSFHKEILLERSGRPGLSDTLDRIANGEFATNVTAADQVATMRALARKALAERENKP